MLICSFIGLGLTLGRYCSFVYRLGHLPGLILETIEPLLSVFDEDCHLFKALDRDFPLFSEALQLGPVPLYFGVAILGALDAINLLLDGIAANAVKGKVALLMSVGLADVLSM